MKPKILFITTAPTEIDVIRGRAMCGMMGDVFKRLYLAPLHLAFEDVEIGHVRPTPLDGPNLTDADVEQYRASVNKAIIDAAPDLVIALGVRVAEAIGSPDAVLPHPAAFVFGKGRPTGLNLERKLRRVKMMLDTLQNSSNMNLNAHAGVDSGQHHGTDSQHPPAPAASHGEPEPNRDGEVLVQIVKSLPAKQIVYGVVMDPYSEQGCAPDGHNDWNPPRDVENAAHEFLQGPMIIGFQHSTETKSRPVESWVEQYPSFEDYAAAMDRKPHKVLRRMFGDQVIHSGAWLLGAKLDDSSWAMFQAGKANNFSPEGLGIHEPIEKSEMPEVEFIDLGKVVEWRRN
ncbi:MAG: XkdF-like putative serine protease domain-containing protein [Methylococcaceae bacterium]|nr:XkdF-like putative serine protease domain-containing protein [Methylococcaceae bacterium]